MTEEKPVDLAEQLDARFCAPEWAIFFEVANGLGVNSRRYADAIAMSLFPSRGLDIHGIEIKRSRGDWLRELKDPRKADVIAQYCDFWWLVTSDEKVADKNEVPKTWGLLVSNGKELRQVKRAERMKPKPVDRGFMGAMFRRAHEWLGVELKKDRRVVDAEERGYRRGIEERDWKIKDASSDLVKLQKRIKEFEERSGVNIDTWHAGNIGDAVKTFLHYSRQCDVTDEMERVAKWIEETATGLREQVAVIKKAKEISAKGQIAPSLSDPVDGRDGLARGPGAPAPCGVDDGGSRQSS